MNEKSCATHSSFVLIENAVLTNDRPRNDTVPLLAIVVYIRSKHSRWLVDVCRYKIERLAVIGDVTDYWIPRNETPRRHTHTHTWIVDHWNHHSVYRDCSFPGSIVLGVWGFSWFHSIRYKIKKKKKKKITFSKIFANRKQKKFNLYSTRTRVFLSNNVKKNSFSLAFVVSKESFRKDDYIFSFLIFLHHPAFVVIVVKYQVNFYNKNYPSSIFFSRIWTSNIN